MAALWQTFHMLSSRAATAVVCPLVLAGCAPVPIGPTVAVMPPPTKPFDVFAQDESSCRQRAAHSIGMPGQEAAAQQVVGSTVAGAVIGGIAGAAIGGHGSAGAGAGAGTVVGAAVGANQSAITGWQAQRAYDTAYQQCMYSRGNLLPGSSYGWSYPLPPAGQRPPSAGPAAAPPAQR